MQRLDSTSSGQYFKQTADIDQSNESWTPFDFSGHFDGNGKTISHVTIDLTGGYYVGFFRQLLSGGELNNVGLKEVNVKGSYFVGGLVGSAAASSSISNCYASGNVNGTSYVGGLVGRTSGSISNSYTLGSVKGTSYVGGLVGYAAASSISDCYASGSVKGISAVGELIGSAVSSNITNSYYDSVTANLPDNAFGSRRTTKEMKEGTPSPTIYTGWDSTIWDFGDDTDYPTLRK